jgi:L-ascorbate metabolism protein UlaG (beta-lactamase superfamily)
MKLTQIRNATQLLTFGGKRFLIDPMLSEKEAWPGFEGTARSHIRNPMVALPVDIATLLDVDAIIVTHTHPDHWDDAAAKQVPKTMRIYVQNDDDAQLLRSQGFSNLVTLSDVTRFEDVELIKTHCQHGSDAAYDHPQLAERLGESSGVVFRHPTEKTLYLAGDSIWIPSVAQTLAEFTPGVVILNTGWAHVLGFGPIIFGKEDILKTHQILPDARIVATHMEAVNHCLTTRQDVLDYAQDNLIAPLVSAPADGETLTF